MIRLLLKHMCDNAVKKVSTFILLFFYLQFVLYSPTYGQSSKGQLLNSNSFVQGELNKYLWGHRHHDSVSSKKHILGFKEISDWRQFGNVTISPDGHFVAYVIRQLQFVNSNPLVMVVQSVNQNWKRSFAATEFKSFGFFSEDSKHFVFEDSTGICILNTNTSGRNYITGYESFKLTLPLANLKSSDLNNQSVKWIATAYKNKDLILHNIITGQQRKFNNIGEYSFYKNLENWFICKTSEDSSELVLFDLRNERDRRFALPKAYLFSKDEKKILLNYGSSLDYVNLDNGIKSTIWTACNIQENISSMDFDQSGESVVFTIKRLEDYSIWNWEKVGGKTRLLAENGNFNVSAGFLLGNDAVFSDAGQYVLFSLQKKMETRIPPKDAVELTIWSSGDNFLQTTQAKRNKPDKLSGVLSVQNGKILYVVKVNESIKLLGDALLIQSGQPDNDRFWDSAYKLRSNRIIDLVTQKSYSLGTFSNNNIMTYVGSPKKNYFAYYDFNMDSYACVNLKTGEIVNLCKGLTPGYFRPKDNKHAGEKQQDGPFQPAGWVEDETGLIIYDDFDIWRLDPAGSLPVNLTNGYGRKHNVRFRIEAATDIYGNRVFGSNEQVLLAAYNIKTKENGFYSTSLGSHINPIKLTMGPYFFYDKDAFDKGRVPQKSKDANIWVVKMESPETGSNLCITNNFRKFNAIESLLEHKKINWYVRQLHHYKCLDGTDGEGILYLPENFDEKKKYPVLIPYYSQYSRNMYVYQEPELINQPTSLCTNPAWMVSQGYLVFVPDIKVARFSYGPTSFSVIEGAAKYLGTLPFVNKEKIGAATHSWSSKLGAYLFTHSKHVSAMAINEGLAFGDLINTAFAPTDNNYESYLQTIEEGFEFGELWKNMKSWLDQTTVLNVDKAQMPLLLSCKNADLKGETYSSQSFEIYTALRRLNKPVWWFRYKNGAHALYNRDEIRDNTIRFTQYFDHFLKNAPAPRWMTQGLPNKLVGVESRLELDVSGNCGVNKANICYICKAWNAQYKRTPDMFTKEIKYWVLDKELETQISAKEVDRRKLRDKEALIQENEILNMIKAAKQKIIKTN